MESYKSQIDTLERKSTKLILSNDTLSSDLSRATNRLKALELERQQEKEVAALLSDRVRELESGKGDETVAEREGELSDALSGTTTTDLKLTIRKLQRELASVGTNAGAGTNEEKGRIIVLENLLEDAVRIKGRYEEDYLKEHRAKLVLERRMQEVMEGKSSDGSVFARLRGGSC